MLSRANGRRAFQRLGHEELAERLAEPKRGGRGGRSGQASSSDSSNSAST